MKTILDRDSGQGHDEIAERSTDDPDDQNDPGHTDAPPHEHDPAARLEDPPLQPRDLLFVARRPPRPCPPAPPGAHDRRSPSPPTTTPSHRGPEALHTGQTRGTSMLPVDGISCTGPVDLLGGAVLLRGALRRSHFERRRQREARRWFLAAVGIALVLLLVFLSAQRPW